MVRTSVMILTETVDTDDVTNNTRDHADTGDTLPVNTFTSALIVNSSRISMSTTLCFVKTRSSAVVE